MKNSYTLILLVFLAFSCQSVSIVRKGTSNTNKISISNTLQSTVNNIVFEGTVISSKTYYIDGMMYTSNIVEVNTIFSGSLEASVVEVFTFGGQIGGVGLSISHGLSLTNNGDLALFYVTRKSHLPDDSELRANATYPVYFLSENVFNLEKDVYLMDSIPHLEKDIYQKLELKFGKKREIVLYPSTTNELAINQIIKLDLNIPNRDIGLVYKLTPTSCNYPNVIAIKIEISSSGRLSYFNHGGIIISYDTSIFGSNVVKNNFLTKSIRHNFRDGNSSRIGGIPLTYQVRYKDLTSSSILLEWYSENGQENQFQLFAGSRWILGATLYFKTKKRSGRTTFKMNSVDSLNLRYDYASNSILSYDYTATTPFIDNPLEEMFTPEITQIYPKGPFQVNDTILIKGVSFGLYPELNIYSKAYNGRKEYKRIPKSYIIQKSDSLIRFILPRVVTSEKGVDWIPVSGLIQVSKSRYGSKIMGRGHQHIEIN